MQNDKQQSAVVEALALRPVTEDEAEEISFYVDEIEPDGLCLTQSRYYRWGDTAIIAVGELNCPNTWDDEDFTHTCQLLEAALANLAPEPVDAGLVEGLGEALHGLSAMLLLTKALDDEQTHAAYEKVVARFAALTIKDNDHD